VTAFERYRGTEFLSPEEMRAVQRQLFSSHLRYAAEQSPYYRNVFRANGLDPAIELENIRSLPLTDKEALAEQNEAFLAVPRSNVVDIVLSSGTTGRPVEMMYTEADLLRLAYNEEISIAGCGVTKDDVALLTCTMDRCFIAGLAYYSGLRSLGAAVIRNGLSSPASHMEIIGRLRPTVLVGVPSFLVKLGQYVKAQDRDPRATGVKKLICIGEPVRDRGMAFLKLGENLEELWGAKIYSTYASSETITSFCECTTQRGGHLHPDLAIVEIVDDQGKTLAPGETGEVVVTPLQMEAMPLIRFKTGDVSFLIDEPCSCGRFSPRLGPILGRKKQMIKFRGTSLYPNSIFAVLDSFPGIGEYYVSATSDYDLSDIVKVYASVKDASLTAAAIMDRLQARLRVRPEVLLSSEEDVKNRVSAGNSRKLIRFVDERKSL
jgi:phenylacetate-CoA ligase